MEMTCKKCKTNTFKINILTDCDKCKYNEIINEISQVEETGECSWGTSYNAGCWLVECTVCRTIVHIPNFQE